MCLLAKPIVDGLERDLEDKADVIRLDTNSQLGLQIARRYGVSALPTLLVFDEDGELIHREIGPPSKSRIIAAVSAESD
jgi:thiol-disulfide isomerase/thioredoxin